MIECHEASPPSSFARSSRFFSFRIDDLGQRVKEKPTADAVGFRETLGILGQGREG
jgi:hypothetical protein